MPILSLATFEKHISKETLRQASKHTVREIDETEKGQFVAYVDEGSDTYDVAITISTKAAITQHQCDCKSNAAICSHQIAVLQHLSKGKKTTGIKATKTNSKTSLAQSLLADADPLAVKNWLLTLFAENKDIELAFTAAFKPTTTHYTPEDIKKTTTEAVKVVAKNRKNIETTEAKKIITLWQQVHEPIIKNIIQNLGTKTATTTIDGLVESCLHYQYYFNTSSTKFTKYPTAILTQLADPINSLQVEETWKNTVTDIVSLIVAYNHSFQLHYLYFAQTLIGISHQARATTLVNMLLHQASTTSSEGKQNSDTYIKTLFDLCVKHQQFSNYTHVFSPITYSNEYNLQLINQLIQCNQLAKAEKFCTAQIQKNVNEEYSIPYYLLLRKIYTLQNNTSQQLATIQHLLPHTFNIEDYNTLIENLTDPEERKKLRTKIFAKAKSASTYNGNNQGYKFCFQLLLQEAKPIKMIELISKYPPLSYIVEHFNYMMAADKLKFITTLLQYEKQTFYSASYEEVLEEQNAEKALIHLVLKNYDIGFLKVQINKANVSYWRRGFADTLKATLFKTENTAV
jgi:hypothetical protein